MGSKTRSILTCTAQRIIATNIAHCGWHPKRLVSGPCWNLYLRCPLFESLSPCCCHDVPCEQQWTHSVFRSVEELECFKHALL